MKVLSSIIEVIGYGLIGYFLSSIIHEFGHVLMGLISKWRFMMMVVGPFKIYRGDINGKIKLGIEKNVSLWGGCGGTYPTEINENITNTFAKILLAGPMASIILGFIGLIGFIFTKSDLMIITTMIAFAEGIVCIVPLKLKTGILYNDGTRYKRIKRGGHEAEEECAILMIAFNSVLNGENSEYDMNMVNILMESNDIDYRYSGLGYAYDNAKRNKDEAELERIRAEAEDIKTKVSKYIVNTYVMD